MTSEDKKSSWYAMETDAVREEQSFYTPGHDPCFATGTGCIGLL